MSSWLEYNIGGDITIGDLIIFLLVLSIAVLIGKLVYNGIRRFLDPKVGKRLSKNTARLVQYGIILFAAGYAFGMVLRLDLSGLILSLGLVGLAVAFASQQIIQNIISGLIISIMKPIQIEDWILVGLSPETGICRVKDITLMSTVLREVDGRIAIVPNSQIINGKVVNYTKAGFTAVTVKVWVSNIGNLDRIKRIVYEEADKDPRILPEVSGEERTALMRIFERSSIRALMGDNADLTMLNPQVNVVDIQGTRTLLNIKVWIREINRRDEIVSEFLSTLKARFDEEKIGLQNS